jgi:uncharacterized membrane protein
MNALLDLTAPFVLVVVLTAVLFYLMPRLTRPDLYFAVTVPPDFRDSQPGRTLLTSYRARIVLASAAALAFLVAGLVVQEGGALAAYLGARNQAKSHAVEPTPVREAVLSPRPSHLPGGWRVQAGPFVILAVTALYLRQHWAAIPDRFPIHWGLDGQPNGWSARTIAGVYGPLLIAAALCLMLTGMAYGVLHASRPIRSGGGLGQAENHFRSTVAGVLLGAQYFLAAIFAWTGLLPLARTLTGPPGVGVILALALVFVLVVTVLLVRQGQGGTRVAQASPEDLARGDQRPVGDRTEDRYWKAGLLYVNPDDPALFVEKRFGVGYTLNFGRPASWIMVGALLLVPLVIALVVKWGSK